MKSLALLLFLLATAAVAFGSNTLRDWKTSSGQTYKAELVDYDEATKVVILRLLDERVVELAYDDLSILDRAWLLEWTEIAEEMQVKLEKMGGVLSVHRSKGNVSTDYWVYQPPLAEAQAGVKPPMLILFHPNGDGHREIIRYLEAAKATGITLVSLDYFRNTNGDAHEAEMLAAFKELLPQIEATVPHDEKRMFMGGCSGGAWRAFHYSAQVPRPWAGIYSNCGWLGEPKDSYNLPYPKMRVAFVNGNQDPVGSYFVDRDSVPLLKAGCTLSVHAFEGAHQVPPPSVQEKAWRWLLGGD